jgi:hypothetical protein
MKKVILIAAIAIFGVMSASAQAKYIGMKKAKAIALKQVPSGKIKSSELEKEGGKMIYSFDIRNKKGGITEVNIDAKTGKVIAVDVESAAKEAKEARDEMKEKKKP